MGSPYLRDIVADMQVFRDRDRPLPMRPAARCSKATAESIPPSSKASDPYRAMSIFAYFVPIGCIELYYDESVPVGQIEIDGTLIAIEDVIASADTAQILSRSKT